MRRHLTLFPATVALTAAVLSGCATTEGEANDPTAPGAEQSTGSLDAMKDLPEGTPTPFSELTAGMCSNFRGKVAADQEIGTVDCAEPHRFEILSVAEIRPEGEPEGESEGEKAPFPGDRGVMDAMRTACEPVLEPFVAKNKGSMIGLFFAPLDKKSWESGNRTGYCAVTFPAPRAGKIGSTA
ncbi:septum formation family protein [Streptomyces californicus]|uniref:septum formation family protein n=1 Tax=Streptomyces californicus TaxID=67351 RepID=UPI00378BA2EF